MWSFKKKSVAKKHNYKVTKEIREIPLYKQLVTIKTKDNTYFTYNYGMTHYNRERVSLITGEHTSMRFNDERSEDFGYIDLTEPYCIVQDKLIDTFINLWLEFEEAETENFIKIPTSSVTEICVNNELLPWKTESVYYNVLEKIDV